ncbi:hypothetical protein II906_07995 [bacterium]|nr:hypothetical protein [bacterium]
MISNVSFGSTYKIYKENNDDSGFNNIQLFSYYLKNSISHTQTIPEKKYTFERKTVHTIVADDSLDKDIEAYCKINCIKYHKLETSELLDMFNLRARMKRPDDGRRIALLDSEKFEELLTSQKNNISECKEEYEQYQEKSVDFMIKSGEEFPLTSLYISPLLASPKITINMLQKYGRKYIPHDYISMAFVREKDNVPDHCTYFGLKDLGYKKIPVYVDKDTYEMGKALEFLR